MKLTSILALNLLLYGPPEGLEDFSDSDFDSNTPQLQPEDLPKINASKMDTNSLRVSSSTMTDMNYVCADISHNIGTLFRVSVLIRCAETPKRIEKYAKFPVSHYMDYETGRIKDKFPHLRDPASKLTFLVNRLAQANLRRRQMFCYALSHHSKIVAPEIPVQQHSEGSVPGTSAFLQPAMSVPHAHSKTTATLCIEPQALSMLLPPLESPSEYSPSEVSSIASSYASGYDQVIPTYIIPPRPKPLAGKQTHSECPYCFKIMLIPCDSEWKYVCCLEYALSSRT